MTQRRGNKRSISRFYKRYYDKTFNYYLITSRLSEIFGRNNIEFFLYKKGLDVVSDFYENHNFELLSPIKQKQGAVCNPSLDAVEAEIARILNIKGNFKHSKKSLEGAVESYRKNSPLIGSSLNIVEDLSFISVPEHQYKQELALILGWDEDAVDELYHIPIVDEENYLNFKAIQESFS